MTIRNILTASAMVAVLGLAGGSAYAEDSHVDESFTVAADANYPGATFVYFEESDVNEGQIQSMSAAELARMPKHIIVAPQ